MVHDQTDPSEVWEVKHNLDSTNVSVECWVEIDDTHTKILPSRVVSDQNTTTITFTRPYVGRVKIHNRKRWSDN